VGHPNITRSFVDCRSAATPRPARLQTRYSHNPPTLHKRFRHACGSRGKQGPLDATNEQFSKCPQLHSLDLENFPEVNLLSPQPFPRLSTFPPRLRVLLSFFFISQLFIHSPPGGVLARKKRHLSGAKVRVHFTSSCGG
jgi:hypothetical protein